MIAPETEDVVEKLPEKPLKKKEKKTQELTDLAVCQKLLKIFQSAVDRKLEFNLSFETVKKLLTYKKCYYTNREFIEENGNLYARSFDRVNSSLGYVEGNVVACTVDINQKKSNLTNEELTMLYDKLILKK